MKQNNLSNKIRTCKCGKTNQEVIFRDRSNQCKECYRNLIDFYNKKRAIIKKETIKKNITQPFDWIWETNI